MFILKIKSINFDKIKSCYIIKVYDKEGEMNEFVSHAVKIMKLNFKTRPLRDDQTHTGFSFFAILYL